MIETRERFRTRTIFLPSWSTFIFLWLFLVEPTVKKTHSLKSMFPHGIVLVPPPHSGSSIVKCPYSFNHQSFPLKKQISYQLSLLISHRKKLNKTNQPNKQKKTVAGCSNQTIFLILGCLCAGLWHQDGFQHTQLPTALVREEFQIGIQFETL